MSFERTLKHFLMLLLWTPFFMFNFFLDFQSKASLKKNFSKSHCCNAQPFLSTAYWDYCQYFIPRTILFGGFRGCFDVTFPLKISENWNIGQTIIESDGKMCSWRYCILFSLFFSFFSNALWRLSYPRPMTFFNTVFMEMHVMV